MKPRIKKSCLLALILGGILFSAGQLAAQTFSVLHSFTNSPDGANPLGELLLVGNTLYGTTQQGGTNDAGAIFEVNTDGSDYAIQYSFTGAGDGLWPQSGLILSGDTLYGAARYGGTNNTGTIFAVNTNGSRFTVLRAFAATYGFPPTYNNDGAWPRSGLVLSGDTLYGTTSSGGTNDFGNGTVFSIKTNGADFTVLYTFSRAIGSFPQELILSGNTLYGVTFGSVNPNGTIFAIDTDGTGFTNLYSFSGGNDGANPLARLLLSDNTLYGTASGGGRHGNGTVFDINTNGSGFTNLYSFTGGNDGGAPHSGLMLYGCQLYGTTDNDGTNGAGTLFAINTNSLNFAILHSFTTNEGFSSGYDEQGVLIKDGIQLYALANEGGTNDVGTVFSLTLLAPPPLAITLAGTNVILTWPTNFPGYTLQAATNLLPPVAWTPVPGQYTVTNPLTAAQMFYRLSQ